MHLASVWNPMARYGQNHLEKKNTKMEVHRLNCTTRLVSCQQFVQTRHLGASKSLSGELYRGGNRPEEASSKVTKDGKAVLLTLNKQADKHVFIL